MFGVFLIIAGIGLLGAILALGEWLEQVSMRRMRERRAVIARERLERRMADVEQREVYDQETAA